MRIGGPLRVAVFLAVLVLPLAQTWRPLLPPMRLAGVEKTLAREPFTPAGWFSGDFQRAFEPWFARRLGLRPWLVRTDNQLRLTLFGETRTGETPVAIGRGGWLYEESYLRKYLRGERRDDARIDRAVREVRRLGELLGRRGVALVVVIAPSKAEIYPDQLPPRYAAPGREHRRTAYDLIAPRLAEAGLDLVDAHRIFLEERHRSRIPLFSRSGTHWNHYGAAMVAERILGALERRRPGRFVQAAVRGARVDGSVWATDNDLGELLNVWNDRPFRGPQVHPVLERREEGRELARLLFVGDSFSLTLARLMAEERLIEPGDTLYYFERRIRFPEEASAPLERERYDVAGDLRDLDAVVLVTNEYWLPGFGFGFVPAALASLERAR